MECVMTRKRRKGKGLRKVRVGLSLGEEVPDEGPAAGADLFEHAWVDAQFRSIRDKGPDGQEITAVIHDRHVYPPRADTSPMKACVACGVPTPANCVGSTGVCLDCHCGSKPESQDQWGPSPLHRAMEVVRALSHVRMAYRL